MKILLVDDEASIERLVSRMITDAGYEFAYAENGFDALAAIEREKPDLVIMDVMMPKMDGFTTCREMRSRGFDAPVIFLSAKGDIVDKGVGFSAGGDDYMVKPFDPRELLMHIEAQLRRAHMASHASPAPDEVLHVGRFTLDVGRFRVTKGDARLALTPKEFNYTYIYSGLVLSKELYVYLFWGKEFVGETSSITVFIKKLREEGGGRPVRPPRHPDRLGHRLPPGTGGVLGRQTEGPRPAPRPLKALSPRQLPQRERWLNRQAHCGRSRKRAFATGREAGVLVLPSRVSDLSGRGNHVDGRSNPQVPRGERARPLPLGPFGGSGCAVAWVTSLLAFSGTRSGAGGSPLSLQIVPCTVAAALVAGALRLPPNRPLWRAWPVARSRSHCQCRHWPALVWSASFWGSSTT